MRTYNTNSLRTVMSLRIMSIVYVQSMSYIMSILYVQSMSYIMSIGYVHMFSLRTSRTGRTSWISRGVKITLMTLVSVFVIIDALSLFYQ